MENRAKHIAMIAAAASSLFALASCDGASHGSRRAAPEVASSPHETGAGLKKDMAPGSRVKEALQEDPNVNTLTIDVAESGDLITLRGTVQTAEQREWAGRTAAKAAGAVPVKNELVLSTQNGAGPNSR